MTTAGCTDTTTTTVRTATTAASTTATAATATAVRAFDFLSLICTSAFSLQCRLVVFLFGCYFVLI